MAEHNNERRPLLDREPIEDIEDAYEGRQVNYKVCQEPYNGFSLRTLFKSSKLNPRPIDYRLEE